VRRGVVASTAGARRRRRTRGAHRPPSPFSPMTETDLEALLASPAGARLAPTPDGRLRCTLTGHVLPRQGDAVATYLG
jgi:hypothetical protein